MLLPPTQPYTEKLPQAHQPHPNISCALLLLLCSMRSFPSQALGMGLYSAREGLHHGRSRGLPNRGHDVQSSAAMVVADIMVTNQLVIRLVFAAQRCKNLTAGRGALAAVTARTERAFRAVASRRAYTIRSYQSQILQRMQRRAIMSECTHGRTFVSPRSSRRGQPFTLGTAWRGSQRRKPG